MRLTLTSRLLRKRVVFFGLFLVGVLLIFCQDFFLQATVPSVKAQQVTYGASFSYRMATELGLDWKQTYHEVLKDFHYVRIPVYWDDVESRPGQLDWSIVDWQIQEAAKAKAKVLLTVGHRAIRYPECYPPEWAKSLPQAEFESSVLRIVRETVMHFQDTPAIEAWQVENEPVASRYSWGVKCRQIVGIVSQEVQLVRSIDPQHRPIIVTYCSLPWIFNQVPETVRFGSDVVAVTLFNKLYFGRPPWGGYVELFKLGILSPLSLSYQRSKIQSQGQKFWVAELQAEPWGPHVGGISKLSLDEANESISPERLRETWSKAIEGGTERIYFWGVEWWLHRRELHRDSALLDTARELMKAK